jgi:hypothetical protein
MLPRAVPMLTQSREHGTQPVGDGSFFSQMIGNRPWNHAVTNGSSRSSSRHAA